MTKSTGRHPSMRDVNPAEAPEGYVAVHTQGRFGGCNGCAFSIPEGECSCERVTGEFPRCYPDLRSDDEPCIFIKKGTS